MTVRLGSTWFVLAFALRTLTTAEIALWLLFSTLTGLQVLFDFGFSHTFSRSIAYARQGRSIEHFTDHGATPTGADPAESQHELDRLWATMCAAYTRLALISLAGGLLIGPAFLWPSIHAANLGWSGWALLGLVICTAALGIWGGRYNAVLVGFNEIALVRRWDALIGAMAALASVVVLQAGAGLVGLVMVGLTGQLAYILRALVLSRRFYRPSRKRAEDAHLRRVVWAAAWRSGLGVLFGYATFQFGGLIAPRLLEPDDVASYLLAIRLFQLASQLANVPFYTQLPTMSEMFASGDRPALIRRAGRRFALALVVMAVLALGIVLVAGPAFERLGSAVRLPAMSVMVVLAIGYFSDRIAAMGLQLQSIANRIEWHWVAGVAFVCVASLSVALGIRSGAIGLAVAYAVPMTFVSIPLTVRLTVATFPEISQGGWRRRS